MQAQQVSVKLYLADGDRLDQDALIPIFHRWIRDDQLGDDKVLIDVADYRHVHDGPGVMIIADHAHYALDESDGVLGLEVSQRRDPIGPLTDKLFEAFYDTLTACLALEQEAALDGAGTFDARRISIGILSRLVAPNTNETFEATHPALTAFVDRFFPDHDITVEHRSDARGPFRVDITLPNGNPSLADLVSRARAS